MALPLAHIRVLDLSRVLAGPYCTMMLADLGAEVIKVERPGRGDDTRSWGPPFAGGESTYFLTSNRNKKSITLNLKSARGQELARTLAARSDVLVENFLPGTLEELGLGYDALQRVNPRLVYCSITGFGQTGPYRDRPGYDLLIQAMGGIMSITGEPDGEPMKVGVAISDVTAGLHACTAILAALTARARSGKGERIDVALLDSTVSWLANVASAYLVTGDPPGRYGNAHASIVPYQAFRARDGWFVIGVGNDDQWRRFCGATGRPQWTTDERFADNRKRVEHREELIPLLEELFATQPVGHWLERLQRAEVPAAPVNPLERVFADPQVQARAMAVEATHPTIGPLCMTGSPLKLASIPEHPRTAPPLLGQHTQEVLEGLLNISPTEIGELKRTGVV